jgi:hypothetical protein
MRPQRVKVPLAVAVPVALHNTVKLDGADECKARLTRFEELGSQDLTTSVGNDPYFPPSGSSIAPAGANCGDSANNIFESCDKFNNWKTFQEVATASGKDFKVFGPSGIQFGDIEQGALGSCYFLAALAAIANENPKIIDEMFVERDLWAQNVFKTKWLVNGKESVISVDNTIPASDNNRNFFSQPSSTGEWWVPILAKTWAKIYSSFNAIEGGFTGNVIAAITRAPRAWYTHSEEADTSLWKKIVAGTQAKFPMCASTGPSSNAGAYGLASGHAYTLLGAFSSPDYGKVVKMFNPWNQDNYEGAVPNTVEVNGPQSGVFTMTFAEFKDAFSSTEIASVYPDYVATSMEIPTGTPSALEVQVGTPGKFFVSITWPGDRMLEPCKVGDPATSLSVANLDTITEGSAVMPGYMGAYNSVSTEVDASSAGTYEIFAAATFEAAAAYLDQVEVTVYAPGSQKPSITNGSVSVNDLALDLYGPTQDDKPCDVVQLSDKGTFVRDDTQLSPAGVPTYWSLDKETVIYWPAPSAYTQNKWYMIGKDSWPKVLAGANWQFRKLAKSEFSCGCNDMADGVLGFGVSIPCTKVTGDNLVYSSIQCDTTAKYVSYAQNYCPKTCSVCPGDAPFTTPPPDVPLPGVCKDSTTYKDPDWGDSCPQWAGFKCSGMHFSADLEKNCPKACKMCT